MNQDLKKILKKWSFPDNIKDYYEIFYIKTKPNKCRKICNPMPFLKTIQREILSYLNKLPLPDYVHGFVPGKSIGTNAEKHLGKRLVLSFDIKDFFESTTNIILRKGLKRYFTDEKLIDQIIKVATLDNGLPQGAPTSPVLANISFLETDEKLNKLALLNDGTYTRYADDLTISTNDRGATDLIGYIDLLVRDNEYRLKHSKTRYRSAGRRQEVTGLVVNEAIQPSRKYRYNLKAKLYNLAKKRKIFGYKINGYDLHVIKGECSWVKKFNPLFFTKYLEPNLKELE